MSTIKSSTTTTTAYSVTADTTGTLVIQTGSTPTTAVTVGTDQSVTFAQAANLPNTFGFKNRIINGAMVIDQRNAGASVTPTTNSYTLDRWAIFTTQSSKFTVQQNAGSVTPPVGYANYLGATVGASANVTVGAGDYFSLNQPIEGFNTADLGFGTASAATVTLSFWVRSSLTGTFGGTLYNDSAVRVYGFTYTISAANTWEQKTITVAGDTSGTWVGATNSRGLIVLFTLGAGSTYGQGTPNTWSSSSKWAGPTGATNWISTNSATFYITGVQLEKGSTATSFDYRPYTTELQLCQRYAASTFPIGTAWAQNAGNAGCVIAGCTGDSGYGVQMPWRFPVRMRATPTTITTYNPAAANANARNFALTANRTVSVLPFSQNSMDAICYTANSSATGDTVGMAYGIHYSVEAEL